MLVVAHMMISIGWLPFNRCFGAYTWIQKIGCKIIILENK
jgi:hypothetical protein